MSRARADVLLAFGLFDWTEISVDVPLILRQTIAVPTGGNAEGTGFGDVRVGLKGTMLKIPERGVGLGLSFDVTAPSGRADSHLGLGGLSYAPQFLFEHRGARGIRSLINIGYLVRPDVRALGRINGDGITVRAATRIPIAAKRPVAFVAEIDSRVSLVRDGDHSFIGRIGLRGQLRNGLVVGAYINGSPPLELGPEHIGGLLSFAWAPPSRMGSERAFDGSPRPTAKALALRHDAFTRRDAVDETPTGSPRDPDGDKILTSVDRCPYIAEDFDGLEDQDGCPELDNDHDGIADAHDLCPNEPEIINGGLDVDGCPDRHVDDGSYQSLAKIDLAELAPHIAFVDTSYELTDESRRSLDRWIELARLNPWMERLELSIYVRPSGSPSEDRQRAIARGDTVAAYCVAAGLDPWRIAVREIGSLPANVSERVRVAIIDSHHGLRQLAPEGEVLDSWLAQSSSDTSTSRPENAVEYSAQGPEGESVPMKRLKDRASQSDKNNSNTTTQPDH